MINICYAPGLGLNLYSLHAVQKTHLIVSDASGTHIIGTNLTFPHSSSGVYLRPTRLPAGTVGAKNARRNIRPNNILRQSRHPVPAPSTRNVTWHHPEELGITPVRAAPTKPPGVIFVPMPKSVPVAAPSPSPAAAPPALAPAATSPPTSVSKPPAPIFPRVSRKIKHKCYGEMLGRTRGDTRVMRNASREYNHRHGLLSKMEHAPLVSMLATRKVTNKIVRQHSAPNATPDLQTAHTSDIPTPSSVPDVEKSSHIDWRHSINLEFFGSAS